MSKYLLTFDEKTKPYQMSQEQLFEDLKHLNRFVEEHTNDTGIFSESKLNLDEKGKPVSLDFTSSEIKGSAPIAGKPDDFFN